MPKKFTTKNSQETKNLGKKIAKSLKAGDLIALYGELGSGKTTLVKGIVAGLAGQEDEVTSPTFTLINEYSSNPKIYHMDWYRLEKVRGQDQLLIEECLGDKASISLIEWPEHGKNIIPAKCSKIFLKHLGGDARSIEVDL